MIGIWTGRPDGTPVVGQFGFASAVPLLNQVNNLLLSRGTNQPEDPRPESVSRGVVCWPGGQSLAPVTATAVAVWQPVTGWQSAANVIIARAGRVNGIRFPVWLDDEGKRVAADCPQAHEQTLIVWPLPLEPWLPESERRGARLPPVSATCPPLGQDASQPLQLTGIRDGAIVKRLPGSAQASLPVQTSGGSGERWWFLNGERLDERGRRLTLRLATKGDYQLLVMDDAGR